MILGSQFYSLRHKTQTKEDITETFAKTAEMGYHAVQLSAIGPIDPAYLKELSDRYALPITCTHSPADRIIWDTDRLIADHKTYGCTEIGIGSMPGVCPRTVEGVRTFIATLKEPIKKIKAAGLTMAYHNHAFEFDGETDIFEYLVEECPDLNFILDVYWLTKAGKDPVAYIKRLGNRVKNLHFKDMSLAEDKKICACGDGRIDFAPIVAAAESVGIPYGLVEQDNAPDFPDAFEEMAKSCRHLTPLVYHK